MWSLLESVPSGVCQGLGAIGADCTNSILIIKVWHLFLIFGIFLIVSLIAYFIRRYNRLDRHHGLIEMTAPYGAAPVARTIRMNPHAFAKAIGEKGYDTLTRTEAAKKLNERYGERYFVCRFIENGSTLFRRELKIQAWHIMLKETEFRLDPETLDMLKKGSASKDDDELDDTYGAEGSFDIFFRKVRWWDLRHWLNHPAREIRYALYVAIFAATLEYSGDLIELLQQLFNTSNI
ncbi:MAG: hypothetical protein QNI84_17100 [Henriciella sp.]|nr:hypothetical protein [Henriciella sp.]